MCKFCDNLRYKEIKVPSKTSLADDNVCEFASPSEYGDFECKNCGGCSDDNHFFSITSWDDNMQLSYYHKIKEVIIAPVSTRFNFNFCPMCGKRISKELHEDLKFW